MIYTLLVRTGDRRDAAVDVACSEKKALEILLDNYDPEGEWQRTHADDEVQEFASYFNLIVEVSPHELHIPEVVAYHQIDGIVTNYQDNILSPERALSAIAATLADTESGEDV